MKQDRNTEKKTLNANYPVLTCMIMYELMYDNITRASSRPKCHNLHIFSPKQRCEMNKSRFASPH